MLAFPNTIEITNKPASWRATARCNDGAATSTRLFFSDDVLDVARAKAICAKCPVREPCLQAALDEREPWGVWGGELFANGHIVENKRRRGRPPRHPRPEPVIDELGFVTARSA